MGLFDLFVCLSFNEVPKPECFTNESVSFSSQFLSFEGFGCNTGLSSSKDLRAYGFITKSVHEREWPWKPERRGQGWGWS